MAEQYYQCHFMNHHSSNRRKKIKLDKRTFLIGFLFIIGLYIQNLFQLVWVSHSEEAGSSNNESEKITQREQFTILQISNNEETNDQSNPITKKYNNDKKINKKNYNDVPSNNDTQEGNSILRRQQYQSSSDGEHDVMNRSRSAHNKDAQLTEQQQRKHANSDKSSTSAFFTLLAGIDPHESKRLNHSWSYLGYLMNLVVCRYLLDSLGSKQDFVVMMRFAKSVDQQELPESQQSFFQNLRIKIKVLPSHSKNDSWKSVIMEKFSLLQFHSEYRHILFLDADVLPVCNLDYYFDLVDQGIWEENVVLAWNSEPANAGFFLLSPHAGDYESLQSQLPFQNVTNGYGRLLQKDPAEGLEHNYSEWNWHCADKDQGLLYHWVRFVQGNVTMMKQSRWQRWKHGKVQETLYDIPSKCPRRKEFPFPKFGSKWMHPPSFYSDFFHFTGQKKPWQIINWTDTTNHPISLEKCPNMYHAWKFLLRTAWKHYQLGSVLDLLPEAADEDLKNIEAFLK